ncbi:MAG TPA: DUF4153 domain-containing protein, partial [bacterium]|nr:DUF4153 domain-containing protein [bacterium]
MTTGPPRRSRLPSVQVALAAAVGTLRRYPFVLASAAGAVAAAIVTLEHGADGAALRLVLAATLGIPLFVALATFATGRGDAPAIRWGPSALALLPLAGFFLAADGWSEQVLVRRYAQTSLGLHALVAVLAWVGRDQPNGFWQFNRRLFERFLVSALFSAVLFLGLALALAALDKLFGIEIDEDTYARLWCVVAFLFNTWYFLGGLPRRYDDLDRSTDYPAGLRIFSQYILVPLVLVYLLILTAYLVRVAVTHEWPSGWIGFLVSGVSVLG